MRETGRRRPPEHQGPSRGHGPKDRKVAREILIRLNDLPGRACFPGLEIGAEFLSERELSEEPVQHSPKRAWYRTKPGIGVIAAAAVIAIGLGGYRYFQIREMDARFLISTPDTVPNKPELVSFALPRGKSAFEKNCASCHGTTMKGDPLKGIPNLTDNDYLYGSGRVSQIERIIMYGIRSGNSKGWDLASMPAFGTETSLSAIQSHTALA